MFLACFHCPCMLNFISSAQIINRIMKLHEFKKLNSKVILTTNIISKHNNHEQRGRNMLITEQIEMDLRNNTNDTHNRSDDKIHNRSEIISITKSRYDTVKQSSVFLSISKLIACVCNSLEQQFQQYAFDIMQNESTNDPTNPNFICSRIHVQAYSVMGNTLTNNDVDIIRDAVFEVFDEINMLIQSINDTVDDIKIDSVILTKDGNNYINPIIYIDEGASKFVYALFNSKHKICELSLSFQIGTKSIKLTTPKLQTQLVASTKITTVRGRLYIESERAKSFRLIGKYFDGNDLFNSIVYCIPGKNDGMNDLFLQATNLESNTLITATLKAIQPYVSHIGERSRKLQLIEFNPILD